MDAELDMSSLMDNHLTTSSQGTEKMWQAPASTHYTHSFFQPDENQLHKWTKIIITNNEKRLDSNLFR